MKKWVDIEEDVELKSYNSYRVGGKAKYLVKPKDRESLIKVINYLKESNKKYFILGSGTNLILPDEDYDGYIIKLDHFKEIEYLNDTVYVGSGVKLNNLVNDNLKHNYGNLYFLYGIPGTVGGAIVQNAGCYNHEIFDYVTSIDVLENNQIKTIAREELKYGYRYTEFKEKNVIILGCRLHLEHKDKTYIQELINQNMQKRISSQPLEYPNAGSVFKNPPEYKAGWLIENAGLKGKKIGGAMVSEKHANFIINFDNCTSNDIIQLIDYIKKEVYDKYKIELELEQLIINW